MYRNRLEKMRLYFVVKSYSNYFAEGIVGWLKNRLKKSNYREYIDDKTRFKASGSKSLVKGFLKVLYRENFTRVLAIPRKC